MLQEYTVPPVIFLMGPTAAGKTDFALKLVDQLDCEIISVDSALIYQDMDIGTAKPDPVTLKKYPHHLVNIIDPLESYSVASFRVQALELIAAIQERKKIPLLVGGTMLYFNALEKGLSKLPPSDPELRQQLETIVKEKGINYLHEQLQKVDPESAERINKNDPQRILRALEVEKLSGISLSQHHKNQAQEKLPFKAVKLCVYKQDRTELHARIEKRFHLMLEDGFVDEVQKLREKYPALKPNLPSMRCVGYRQVWQYLEGQFTYEQMMEKGIVATRQLAKRQLTWLRSMENISWLDLERDDISTVFTQLDFSRN